MAWYDQHLHSRHSFDSQAEPADNVRRAIELRLAGLTFTEHLDTHPTERAECRYDDAAYSAEIARLRLEFGGRIFVGKGIEVCYQPPRMDEIVEFLHEHEFDCVLLSVHWLRGWPLHHRDRWAGRTLPDVTRTYLEEVREATEMCARMNQDGLNPFNILGHLDLVRRYALRFLGIDEPLGCADVVDDILRNCLAADLVPEMNTSSMRQGLRESMPGADVIRRYAELGGTAISLGSDAHAAKDIGAGFAEAAATARTCGIGQLAVFKLRRMEVVPLA